MHRLQTTALRMIELLQIGVLLQQCQVCGSYLTHLMLVGFAGEVDPRDPWILVRSLNSRDRSNDDLFAVGVLSDQKHTVDSGSIQPPAF